MVLIRFPYDTNWVLIWCVFGALLKRGYHAYVRVVMSDTLCIHGTDMVFFLVPL